MTSKRLLLTGILTLLVVWAAVFLLTMPAHPTSGSGNGNILTTRGP
jgi:hypothetical protein